MKFFWNLSDSHRAQLFTALSVNLISISHGMVLGWVSPVLPLLKSDDSPLDTGPLTVEQSSWIGSSHCLTGIIGLFTFIYMSNRFGCKFAMNWLGLSHLGFLLLVLFGTRFSHLIIARLIGGIASGGVFGTMPLFIADIAEPKLRGGLGSIFQLFYIFGIFSSYLVGAFVDYRTFPKISMVVPIAYSCIILYFPETPQSCIKLQKIEQAEKSLKFYRGIKEKDQLPKENADELEMMIKKVIESNRTKVQLNEFNDTTVKKGIFIGVALILINQFSGSLALSSYAASIFQDAGSSISPNFASIILSIMQLAGAYFSMILIDKTGRRILLLVSASGVTIGLLVTAIFTYLNNNFYDLTEYSIIPVISLPFVIFMACIGIFTVPFVMIAEILPLRLRLHVTIICLNVLFIASFLVLKFFPIMVDTIEIYGAMFLFAGVCGLSVIFIFFVVPETKGKNLMK